MEKTLLKVINIKTLAVIAFLLFLTFRAFDGLLRFLLVNRNLTWVAYVPTFLLLSIILLKAIQSVNVVIRIRNVILTIIALLIMATAWGLLNIQNYKQVFFGVYVFLPFLFGAVMAPEILTYLKRLYPFFLGIFFLTILGIFIDYKYDLPWSGFEYQLAGLTIEGARAWNAFGLERVAGFARASFEAASITLISALFVIALTKQWLIKTLTWAVGLVAVALTTAKGVVFAYLILTLLILAKWINLKRLLRIFPYIVVAIVIILPIYSWRHQIDIKLISDWDMFLLSSFEDRITDTWPHCYELVSNFGSLLLGRGLGGIGAPQTKFEPLLNNPGDNLFAYLFVVGGFLATPILIGIAYYISQYADVRRLEGYLFYLLGVGMLVYGITTNIIEGSWMGMFLGMVLGSLTPLKKYEQIEMIRKEVIGKKILKLNGGAISC